LLISLSPLNARFELSPEIIEYSLENIEQFQFVVRHGASHPAPPQGIKNR
jgi:hypothetical protein